MWGPQGRDGPQGREGPQGRGSRRGGGRAKGEAWTAERIAALRAELGLTQTDMAEELGVRQQTVSEWETGRSLPRGASAKMLAHLAERRGAYDASGGGEE